MLVHIKHIIKKAQAGNYAVGAFNVNDLEMVLAVLAAAEKMKSPAIIQVTESAIKYAGLKELFAIVKIGADEIRAPIAIHLDHGQDFETIKKCVAAGFSSVMIDGSALPYATNVALSKKVVQYCHRRNVFVQAELGQLQGPRPRGKREITRAQATDPAQAADFALATGIDALAVSIGNIHGVKKIIKHLPKKLNLKRLKEIAKLTHIPLVLHGASGFPAEQIKKAVKSGIKIVNIDSELRLSFAAAEKKFFRENNNIFDPRKILSPAIAAMRKTVERKIKMFGSENKI
ncbi:MAG: class II fructose-bisphosphate aldolase [Parcubacteria group bacterium]